MARNRKRQFFTCPHCWDHSSVLVDLQAEGRERFFEDCVVCGNPVQFHVDVEDGELIAVGADLPGAPRGRPNYVPGPHAR